MPLTRRFVERVTGIEPALSAWEDNNPRDGWRCLCMRPAVDRCSTAGMTWPVTSSFVRWPATTPLSPTWWTTTGQDAYPDATGLLITADGGGSNGYRTRAWKTELAALADQTGLTITVCHLPPGTSKWNKIEHRLFSHISMNWRGRPLTSHEVILNTIAATRTWTGLSVHAELDTALYPTGVKIPHEQMTALEDNGTLHRHDWHGEWNYTLNPTTTRVETDKP